MTPLLCILLTNLVTQSDHVISELPFGLYENHPTTVIESSGNY
jgi:hypothetical protein